MRHHEHEQRHTLPAHAARSLAETLQRIQNDPTPELLEIQEQTRNVTQQPVVVTQQAPTRPFQPEWIVNYGSQQPPPAPISPPESNSPESPSSGNVTNSGSETVPHQLVLLQLLFYFRAGNHQAVFMDNCSTGLVTAARASVKTDLVVYLAELEQQNLSITIDKFLGLVTKG